jgi:hypothetical protein
MYTLYTHSTDGRPREDAPQLSVPPPYPVGGVLGKEHPGVAELPAAVVVVLLAVPVVVVVRVAPSTSAAPGRRPRALAPVVRRPPATVASVSAVVVTPESRQ